jgi:hypothetical protein
MARSAGAVRTLDQNRRLWGLVTELRKRSGISQEDAEGVVRRMCREVSGQDHSSLLSQVQAERLLSKMESEISGYGERRPAKREPWGERGPGPRDGQRITPRLQEVLQALFEQAGLDTRERQMGFCRRQFGLPWPQTQAHADALVEPLKAMVLRAVPAETLRARVATLQARTDLDTWKRGFVEDLARQMDQAARAGRSAKSVLTTHKLLKLVECELAAVEDR